MRDARTSIRLRSDYAGAHRVLTAAAGLAGDSEAAAAALQELQRAQPGISRAWIAEHVPIKHDSDRALAIAQDAVKLAPGLEPAAALAGRLLSR